MFGAKIPKAPASHAAKTDVPPGMRDESRRTVTNPVQKDSVTFTKYSAETAGEYTELVVTLAPGGAAPLHYHTSYTETFSAIDTTHIKIGPKGEPIVLEPGENKLIQLKENHCFYNPTDEEIRFKVTLRPASEGFEKFIYIVYGLARDGYWSEKGGASRLEYGAIGMVLSDTYMVTRGSGLVNFLGRIVAAYARWRGVEEDLLYRYWY